MLCSTIVISRTPISSTVGCTLFFFPKRGQPHVFRKRGPIGRSLGQPKEEGGFIETVIVGGENILLYSTEHFLQKPLGVKRG